MVGRLELLEWDGAVSTAGIATSSSIDFRTTLLVAPNSQTELRTVPLHQKPDNGHRTTDSGQGKSIEHLKQWSSSITRGIAHIEWIASSFYFSFLFCTAGFCLALSWPRKEFDCGEKRGKMKSKSYQLKPVSMSLLTHVNQTLPNYCKKCRKR